MLPPNNIPTMLNLSEESDGAIADVLKDPSLENCLTRLSRHFPIKLSFNKPIMVHNKKDSITQHTFKCFFVSTLGNLCYGYRKNSRKGYIFNYQTNIIKIELLDNNKEFKSFEEFKKKFNIKFIKENQILSLWNSKSSYHGKKYNKKDFHKINKRGKQTLNDFLKHFENINSHNNSYRKSNLWDYDVYVLTSKYKSDHHTGRDISISHQTNAPHIFYSSEYPGCLNGRYGILANKNEYLHFEDD